MEKVIGNGTAEGMLAFLDNMVEKGRLRSGVVEPLKSASRRILSTVDGDGWTQTDVRSIDIDDYMQRFGNMTVGRYNAPSLRAYRSRLLRSINWYNQFLTQPGWVPKASIEVKAQVKPATSSQKSGSKPGAQNGHEDVDAREPAAKPQTPIPVGANLITYPFPLTSGELAYLYLPAKLGKIDATRIAALLEALAISN